MEALLGEGGMGLVFRAHDLKNDRLVALKIMLGNLVNKPQFRSRFLHEAEAIAHFNSPAIVKIFDTGVHEESPYIVMEHIEGGSLINYLRQLDYSGARPTIELITTLAAQIAEGLSYAHQRGLIHRDIKPGNILLKMRKASTNRARPSSPTLAWRCSSKKATRWIPPPSWDRWPICRRNNAKTNR
ncbi:MAG: serine/threonine protein kinase [Chloroflexi bacterium]|nr:serine/threonine protein kinase [Chloroflexota bacterium]